MEPTIPPQSSPAQPVTPTPQTPVPQKNNSLFIIVVIILLFALGAAGFFAYQNQQLKQQIVQNQVIPTPTLSSDPTANWKTYIDNQEGFNISYPSSWKVEKSLTGGTPFSLSSTIYPSSLPQGDGRIFFFSDKNSQGMNLLNWVKKYGNGQGKLPQGVYSQSSINNIPTVEINYTWTSEFINWLNSNYPTGATEGPPPLGTKFRDIYLSKGDLIVEVQAMYPETKKDFFDEFDKILSTFKFTN